jgi:hypothetical protein
MRKRHNRRRRAAKNATTTIPDPVAAGSQKLVLPDVPNVIVYRVRGERVDFGKLVGHAAGEAELVVSEVAFL